MSQLLPGKTATLPSSVRGLLHAEGSFYLTDTRGVLDCVSATLGSRNSILMPCDSSTRVLELLVLLDQHWSFSRLKYPICLLSRTGREMLTFVRSMMEWLGGTISKEDVGDHLRQMHCPYERCSSIYQYVTASKRNLPHCH